MYRLLMSLAVRIDGAYWPEEDASRVHELLDLVRSVTGRAAPAEPVMDPCI